MQDVIKIQKNVDTLYIYWNITDLCNFRCSYCPTDLHSGKSVDILPTIDQINIFIDKIIDIHLGNRLLHVTISGGEPTLHPLLPLVIDRIVKYGYVNIITNGSRSVDWWKSLPALPSMVVISFHPEFSKIDKINELCSYLLSNNVSLQINVSAYPDSWQKVKDFVESVDPVVGQYIQFKTISNLGITDSNNQRGQYGETVDYTAEQFQFMQIPRNAVWNTDSSLLSKVYYAENNEVKEYTLNVYRFIREGNNRFKGWNCSAGTDCISIIPDGRVYAGLCRIKYLGTLDDFMLEQKGVVCSRDYCPSPADVAINKSR